jgi:hypothetical protein
LSKVAVNIISLQQKTTIITNRTSETAITTITTIIINRYNMNNTSSADSWAHK